MGVVCSMFRRLILFIVHASPELDQLRVFLDEKDKHIKDLMDTLKNFHVNISNINCWIIEIHLF